VLIVIVPGRARAVAYLAGQAAVSIENVDLHELVQRQAVTDELTGLSNHRRFQEVMAQEVGRAKRFGQDLGLVMLDIHDFKTVNDSYGHQQGDVVLREVARVLRDSSREIDEPAPPWRRRARGRPAPDRQLRVTASLGPRRCRGRGTTRGR